jgi:glycogen debranching enzyme
MGKPVEINALWYNALRAVAAFARRLRRDPGTYDQMAERVRAGFARFWNSGLSCCYDVLDGPDGHDASVRPNQILAVSLPESPLTADQQRAVVDVCARKLLTSHGLRSLAPDDARYIGRYQGDVNARDAAYHQGTVWGWLLGPFARAHLRVYRDPDTACGFLEPMARHLAAAGLGSLSEIFDGDPPFEPRGCIAQAWTVAEVLRAWTEISGFRRDGQRRATVAHASRRR